MQLSPAPAFGFLHRGDEIFSRKVVAIAQIAGVEREKTVCCSSADSLFRQIKRFKMPSAVLWA